MDLLPVVQYIDQLVVCSIIGESGFGVEVGFEVFTKHSERRVSLYGCDCKISAESDDISLYECDVKISAGNMAMFYLSIYVNKYI